MRCSVTVLSVCTDVIVTFVSVMTCFHTKWSCLQRSMHEGCMQCSAAVHAVCADVIVTFVSVMTSVFTLKGLVFSDQCMKGACSAL